MPRWIWETLELTVLETINLLLCDRATRMMYNTRKKKLKGVVIGNGENLHSLGRAANPKL